MDYSYLFIENLPEGITLAELSDVLKPKIPCQIIHMLQYSTKNGIVDFRSSLAKLRTPLSSASTNIYKKNPIKIGKKELQLNFISTIEPFHNNFLFFNVNKDVVKSLTDSIIEPKLIRGIVDIPTHSFPISVLQGTNREVILQKLNTIQSYEWVPVIEDPTPFTLPNIELEELLNFSPIHDVFLLYKKEKHGFCKAISKTFSNLIKNAKDNEVFVLPDIDGPIEDVVSFLWGKSICISFEKLPFLFTISKFLQSEQLEKQIELYLSQKISPLSISSLALAFENENLNDVPFEYVLSKIDEIIGSPDCLLDFPVSLCDLFIKKLNENSVDPNKIVIIIDNLPLEKAEKIKYLNSLDRKQITSSQKIFQKYIL